LGFGANEECWICDYAVYHGTPSMKQVWVDLDNGLRGDYKTQDGRTLKIKAAGIDSGGHFSQQVVSFCTERPGRKLWAVKGAPGLKRIWPLQKTKGKHGAVFSLGVDM